MFIQIKRFVVTFYYKVDLLFFLLIFISLATAIYYQIAWGPSMTDSFPAVERLLDPKFITNDFYTNTFKDFSARYYVSKFYILGGLLFNTHYTTFIAYANIFRILITTLLVYFFYLILTENRQVAFIGTFLGSFTFFLFPKTVGWVFMTQELSGQNISLLFNMLALIFILKNKFNWSFIPFSISFLFHPVVAFHGICVGLVIFFSKYGRSGLKNTLKDYKLYLFFIYFLVFVLMWYIPLKEVMKGVISLSAQEYTQILGYFRHPHHYIPSQFGLFGWVIFISYFISLVYMIFVLRKSYSQFSIIVNLLLYLCLMMIVGYVFVEIYPIKIVVTLIPYRSLWIFPLIYMGIYGLYIFKKLENRDNLSFLLLHVPIILFFISSNYPTLLKYKFTLIFCVLIYLYAAVNDFKVLNNKTINNINVYLSKNLFEKYSLQKIYTGPILIYLFISLYHFNIQIPNINDSQNLIYKWIQNNTFEQSIIVSEPTSGIDNSLIRLVARRAVVVSGDFPFVEKYYKEWHQRSKDVYGNNINIPEGNVDDMSEDNLKLLFDNYKANFLIRTKKIDDSKFFNMVSKITNNNIVVYLYEYKQ